jgi:hypothetical protein
MLSLKDSMDNASFVGLKKPGCFLTWEQVAEFTTCASALKDDNMVVHQLFGA